MLPYLMYLTNKNKWLEFKCKRFIFKRRYYGFRTELKRESDPS